MSKPAQTAIGDEFFARRCKYDIIVDPINKNEDADSGCQPRYRCPHDMPAKCFEMTNERHFSLIGFVFAAKAVKKSFSI
jgi:hypothetical protein